MKRKQGILYILIAITLLMVVVPLIPHHHHANGILCMKDDIRESDCPCHHPRQHHSENNDPCCTNDCMAHFESNVPSQQVNEFQPHCFHFITLFTEPLLRLLTLPEGKVIHRDYTYLESLHGMFITRAAGLRAPPRLFC